jgi:hypothetical protein
MFNLVYLRFHLSTKRNYSKYREIVFLHVSTQSSPWIQYKGSAMVLLGSFDNGICSSHFHLCPESVHHKGFKYIFRDRFFTSLNVLGVFKYIY